MAPDHKISCFVVAYSRAQLLRACLQRARFVDELIVIDKSSIDDTEAVAREFADRYERVPWSPMAEDNRAYAESLCSYDWVLCLDDDEVLGPETGSILREKIDEEPSDVYLVPIRHYILGRWEPTIGRREWRPCLYRRGHLRHSEIAHLPPSYRGTIAHISDERCYIQNLSHPDVASWIAKNLLFTSTTHMRGDIIKTLTPGYSLGELATMTIKRRLDQSAASSGGDDYYDAVALLRFMADLMDMLMVWERLQPNGREMFSAICREVDEWHRWGAGDAAA